MINLVVRDDGQNGLPEIREGHYGLMGLQERAVQLNGRLHLMPQNGGAHVQLQLPLPPV